MPGIVKAQPACRHCGATVRPLRKCPRCGRRAIAALFGSPPGSKH